MPHPRRFDFVGAIHLLSLRGRVGAAPIFFEPEVFSLPSREWWSNAPRVQAFVHFMVESLEECGSCLFGYHVEAHSAVLLLQTGGVPLERVMQRLCGSYSRYWRKSFAQGSVMLAKGPFAGRYDSKVIAPEYLPHALRRLHAKTHGMALKPGDGSYPFSSEQAYTGARSRVPLAIDTVHSILAAKGLRGAQGYREFMQQSESAHVAGLFAKGSPQDAHIVGNRAFVLKAHDAAAHPPRAPTREELIAAVAERLRMRPEDIIGGQREVVLARSMVAWYALRTGAATMSQVGRWFSVSGATVGRGMRAYRRTAPHYFGTTLPELKVEPDT